MRKDLPIKQPVCSFYPTVFMRNLNIRNLVRLAAFRLVEAGLENKPGIESESSTSPIIICLSSIFYEHSSTYFNLRAKPEQYCVVSSGSIRGHFILYLFF